MSCWEPKKLCECLIWDFGPLVSQWPRPSTIFDISLMLYRTSSKVNFMPRPFKFVYNNILWNLRLSFTSAMHLMPSSWSSCRHIWPLVYHLHTNIFFVVVRTKIIVSFKSYLLLFNNNNNICWGIEFFFPARLRITIHSSQPPMKFRNQISIEAVFPASVAVVACEYKVRKICGRAEGDRKWPPRAWVEHWICLL